MASVITKFILTIIVVSSNLMANDHLTLWGIPEYSQDNILTSLDVIIGTNNKSRISFDKELIDFLSISCMRISPDGVRSLAGKSYPVRTSKRKETIVIIDGEMLYRKKIHFPDKIWRTGDETIKKNELDNLTVKFHLVIKYKIEGDSDYTQKVFPITIIEIHSTAIDKFSEAMRQDQATGVDDTVDEQGQNSPINTSK